MSEYRIAKVFRAGTGLALIIPAAVCRELGIKQGDYFGLVIWEKDIIFARRLKISYEGGFGGSDKKADKTINYDR
ncbi:MAG: AbrB/MazE/SpoVT family DNA-binding domain-containing protein [bacterium]